MAHTIRDLSGVFNVVVDGSDETSRITAISTSHSIDQDCGTAKVTFWPDSSGAWSDVPIAIYANATLIFNGTVRKPILGYYKEGYTYACTDVMQNITRPWGGAGTDPELDALFNRVYESQTADAVRVNLMECMAVDPTLHVVIAPSPWTLGTIEPVVLRVGQTSLQLIRQLDEIEGMVTFSRGNGAIYTIALANTTSAATYTQASNIYDLDMDLFGAETVTNKCVLYGLQSSVLAIGGPGVGEYAVTNIDVPDPPKYQTKVFRTNLVENDADALTFATGYVTRNNFIHERGKLVVKGNEARKVGETITINASRIYRNNDRFVASVNHEFNKNVGWITNLGWMRVQ